MKKILKKTGEPNFDNLFKVREFLNDLNTNFQIDYNPHSKLSMSNDRVQGKDLPEAVHAYEAHKEGDQDVV